MVEYIEREAVLALSDDFELTLEDDEIFFEYIPVKAVKELPAADVAPVRRGRWMYLYDENYRCSECGEDFALIDGTGFLGLLNYCPNCGARMDGEA